MAVLKTMNKGTKTKWIKEGRDICISCGSEIKVGDKYATTGGSGSKKNKLTYCEKHAKEKNIV